MWKIVAVVTYYCMGNATECVFSNHATANRWATKVECLMRVPPNEKRIELIGKLYQIEFIRIESACEKT